MSYISEALKKAERERLGKKDEFFDGRLGTKKESAKRVGSKKAIVSLIAFVFLVLFTFLGYRVLSRPEKISHSTAVVEIGNMFTEARIAQKSGDLIRAEVIYRKIVSVDPDHIDSLNNLGIICMTKGENKEAESLFRRVISLNSRHVYGHYNLACLYAKEGKSSEALTQLKHAADIDTQVKAWAMKDMDFLSLRNKKEFQQLVGIEK
ncbi:MAG: tetratricopeptide repeat protein [Syntrophales bacterium]|nr:tetratricopeptide repeat protein [Syntrophales bacterium]